MKKLFNGESFDQMMKSTERTKRSRKENRAWDKMVKTSGKDADLPDKKSAITASFDYVYERLGGHDGFLEWARFSPTNTTKFYEWRSKQLQKESVSDSSEGKIVINVLNYHNDADSIQLPAEGLPTPTVPSV
tara:strand:- start:107 stop:502 length:396 start_codon:yes stop_codon:yes gene_type:complete